MASQEFIGEQRATSSVAETLQRMVTTRRVPSLYLIGFAAVCLQLLSCHTASALTQRPAGVQTALKGAFSQQAATRLPSPTSSGYLSVNTELGSAIFYAYYEAQQEDIAEEERPLLLWLQVC